MNFEDVIKKRFACREFLDREVEEEKISKILEAANRAPTAKNLQPFKMSKLLTVMLLIKILCCNLIKNLT